MSLRIAFGIAACGALGALCRWGVTLASARWFAGSFPVGTLVANALGCLLLGVLTGISVEILPPDLRIPLSTGFLGSFTTFSTFSVESVRLAEQGQPLLAGAYLFASVGVGLGCATAGLVWGRSFA